MNTTVTTKNFTDMIVKNSTISDTHKPGITKSLVMTASLFICILLLSVTAFGSYTLLPAKVHYHVSKIFLISQEIDNAQVFLGLLLPTTGSYQAVNNVSVQWEGKQETSSRAYVDVLKLWDTLPGKSEKMAVVEYDVNLPQGPVSWRSPVDRFDLLPQEGIESTNADIKKTADSISNDADHNSVYRIFKFTSNYLDYSEIGCEDTNISALEAFHTKVGACIAYSRLMVALCRASEIPAKMIIGTLMPDILYSLPQTVTTGTPGSGHAWVEYGAQDSWHLADPSSNRGLFAFLAFNRNDGRHLSFGDFGHFTESKNEILNWATEHAQPKDIQLTSVFASSSEKTTLTTETTIKKTWDQRWLNVILALGGVAFVLCKIRDRILSKYFST